ncbi:hypothetical protein GW17_00034987 [Ensete ventricosum]|nr:hypothetical protein GW17_00034987 [Ensete ventricosum]
MGAEVVATLEKWAVDSEVEVERLKATLGSAEQEANRSHKEVEDLKATRCCQDDEILKLSRDTEALRAKLQLSSAKLLPNIRWRTINPLTTSFLLRTELLCFWHPRSPRAPFALGMARRALLGRRFVELSPNSSLDFSNSFWTSFIYRFISRNCALSVSIESEDRRGAPREVMGPHHRVTVGLGAALVLMRFLVVLLWRSTVVMLTATSIEGCGK